MPVDVVAVAAAAAAAVVVPVITAATMTTHSSSPPTDSLPLKRVHPNKPPKVMPQLLIHMPRMVATRTT